jgi:hypothetical protein
MTKKHYLHIAFHFNNQPITKELELTFNKLSEDWIRYTGNCWVTWTSHNSTTWFNHLKPYLRDKDQIMIFELKSPQEIQGWAPKWVWDWFNKVRI